MYMALLLGPKGLFISVYWWVASDYLNTAVHILNCTVENTLTR